MQSVGGALLMYMYLLLKPLYICMQSVGDALLLDLRAFHFGTANRSGRARVQLSATFREPTALCAAAVAGGGDSGDSTLAGGGDGFTYALREELVGRRTLGDFLP